VALGESHSLLLTAKGNVLAFGYNGNGQLGNGSTLSTPVPTPVAGVAGITRIAAGANHSLALRSDGTVVAWGYNATGQLGDGTQFNRLNFVQVSGASAVKAIAAGRFHSLALRADGLVFAWGGNTEGQVGDGSNATTRTTPVQVASITNVAAIAAGGRHNLALLGNGSVVAWGANDSGQLGDGTTTNRTSPVLVSSLTGVVAIAAGESHSLAIKNDGSVWAWGANGFGQLGDGTFVNRISPVPITSLGTGVGLIACGEKHSLAVKAGGAMYAWGNNGNSQLGDGANANSAVPVQLTLPIAVVAIAGGARHSAAIDASRKLYVWGDNFFGQVGNRSGNFNPQSGALNVLRGDSRISEGTSSSGTGVGTGSNSGSSVLEIDGQATSFDFGAISAGNAKTTSGKYGNQSASDPITGITLAVTGGGFSLQSTDCPSTLTPNQNCNFTIAFNPGSALAFSGELVVNSSVVGSPERRSLSGVGVATAAISLAKSGVSFPPQTIGTSSGAANVTLTNSGNATLSVTSVSSSLGDFSATHDCASVAPGAACTLAVTFSPSAPSGRAAYLTITSNAGNAPNLVTVDGTGVSTSGPIAPTLTAVQSRKSHGFSGTFSLPIDMTQSISGAVTVESRMAASSAHAVVFVFNTPITAIGSATVKDASNNNVGTVTPSSNGNEVIVSIANVPDNQRVTVSLTNVNNAGTTVSASIGFLVGDVNNTRSVTASDILRAKGRTGQATSANYLHDVDLAGSIDATDVALVKARAGLSIP
jgi:alpha-tubulin suppressor-like RCC1 family protein